MWKQNLVQRCVKEEGKSEDGLGGLIEAAIGRLEGEEEPIVVDPSTMFSTDVAIAMFRADVATKEATRKTDETEGLDADDEDEEPEERTPAKPFVLTMFCDAYCTARGGHTEYCAARRNHYQATADEIEAKKSRRKWVAKAKKGQHSA
jgi:hypothetical protein